MKRKASFIILFVFLKKSNSIIVMTKLLFTDRKKNDRYLSFFVKFILQKTWRIQNLWLFRRIIL